MTAMEWMMTTIIDSAQFLAGVVCGVLGMLFGFKVAQRLAKAGPVIEQDEVD